MGRDDRSRNDWRDTYGDGLADACKEPRARTATTAPSTSTCSWPTRPSPGDIKQFECSPPTISRTKNGKLESAVGRDLLSSSAISISSARRAHGGGTAAGTVQQFQRSARPRVHLRTRRILAVVGLHGNTFKPHTGTKTSVLFVQKWNDDPRPVRLCPRVDDYHIFFATQRRRRATTAATTLRALRDGELLRDAHRHFVSPTTSSTTTDLTTTASPKPSKEFAAKEELSFLARPFDSDLGDAVGGAWKSAE